MLRVVQFLAPLPVNVFCKEYNKATRSYVHTEHTRPQESPSRRGQEFARGSLYLDGMVGHALCPITVQLSVYIQRSNRIYRHHKECDTCVIMVRLFLLV